VPCSVETVSGLFGTVDNKQGVNFCFVPVRVPEAGLDKKLIWLINFEYWQLYLCISSWFTLLTQALLVALLRMI
jgi:hypothetical protein